MNARSNPGVGKILLKHVAVFYANDVQVIDRSDPLWTEWANDSINKTEQFVIKLRGLSAFVVPAYKVMEFSSEESRLHGVEASVVALDVVIILPCLAVIT